MTEDEKIKEVIAKYDSFFENTVSDVGHTKKGVWFFYEYDEEHDYYTSFFRFETAEELEQIIAEVLAEEFNILIEITAENIFHEINEITTEINEAAESCYVSCIPNLLKNMEIFNIEYKKSAERLEVIFQSLSGVFKDVGEQPASKNLFDI